MAEISEKYSFKDFTGWDLSDRTDMSGIIIEGSCFSHETPDSIVFPSIMTGTTFMACNLDNCFIPPGNTVQNNCSKRRFKIQNDLEDWICDRNNVPVEPVGKKYFLQLGLSIDPASIPAIKQEICATTLKLREREIARRAVIDAAISEFERNFI